MSWPGVSANVEPFDLDQPSISLSCITKQIYGGKILYFIIVHEGENALTCQLNVKWILMNMREGERDDVCQCLDQQDY